MKYFTIGMTGPTGAGKSTVSKVFCDKGFAVVDCDKLSRKAVEPGGAAIGKLCEFFGEDILSESGELIRPLVAQRAFSTSEGREKLNAAVHPAVLQMTAEEIACAHSEGKHVLVDAPLLFEAGVDRMCDICVAVVASEDIRLGRICQRDSIDEDAARLRMSAQHSESYYTDKSDFVLSNNESPQELREQAEKLAEKIINMSEAISNS